MIKEPNFEGEKMKMPTEGFSATAPVENPKTQLWLIALLGTILIIILGGLVYWYYMSQNTPTIAPAPIRPPVENNTEPETPTATAQTESFGAVSTSDEITAIEADVDSTNLDSLETELGQIDAILDAAATE